MRPFEYRRAESPSQSQSLIREATGAVFLAGGTELVTWLAEGIVAPDRVVDIAAAVPASIVVEEGVLRIGAGARLSDVAADPLVRREVNALAEAIEAAASPAIRNAATLGGNLLQRTRCPYFRSAGPCNKRIPESGCGARSGDHRTAAVLATSADCIATHPSDPAVALVALGGTVLIDGGAGSREIPIELLYPAVAEAGRDHLLLDPADLIVEIRVPLGPLTRAGRYRKVRDRAAFDFAVASTAAHLLIEGGVVTDVRVALGGVAGRPWRARVAEAALKGSSITETNVRAALRAELATATPLPDNAFKIELITRLVTATLLEAANP